MPVAFHVNYWNHLGWRDRFADARFAARQSDYLRRDYLQTVYTPGVMKNGREWRGWACMSIPPAGEDDAGILDTTVHDDAISVAFTPRRRYPTPLVLNLALLGVDLKSRVTTSENAGKHLRHDFVALDFRQYPRAQQEGRLRWALPGRLSHGKKDIAAIALWVTTADDPTPLQATGGWLK